MRRRAAAGCFAVLTVAASLAACTDSTVAGTAASAMPHPVAAAKTACDLITPDVIKAAHFNQPVERQTRSADTGKQGISSCSYGDDPDPRHIRLNYLLLVVMTPASLAAHHTTAEDQAKASSYPCTANQIREIGPTSGIGRHAYFCASKQHAPAGGWIEGDNLYLLEVGTPPVDYGTTAQRAIEFESVARAIAKNAGS